MSEKRIGEHSRTYKLHVTTKVMQLCAKDPKRTGILVYNNGTATVYILSAQNMTIIDGMPVIAKASYRNRFTTARLYIVAESGTQDIRVQVDGS